MCCVDLAKASNLRTSPVGPAWGSSGANDKHPHIQDLTSLPDRTRENANAKSIKSRRMGYDKTMSFSKLVDRSLFCCILYQQFHCSRTSKLSVQFVMYRSLAAACTSSFCKTAMAEGTEWNAVSSKHIHESTCGLNTQSPVLCIPCRLSLLYLRSEPSQRRPEVRLVMDKKMDGLE